MTDVFFACFDLSDRKTFENLETKWLPEITVSVENAPIIIIGCKAGTHIFVLFFSILEEANQARDGWRFVIVTEKLKCTPHFPIHICSSLLASLACLLQNMNEFKYSRFRT